MGKEPDQGVPGSHEGSRHGFSSEASLVVFQLHIYVYIPTSFIQAKLSQVLVGSA